MRRRRGGKLGGEVEVGIGFEGSNERSFLRVKWIFFYYELSGVFILLYLLMIFF